MQPTLFLIDFNTSQQDSLAWVLNPMGVNVKAFTQVEDFLDFYTEAYPACLLLDIHAPHATGPDIQQKVLAHNITIPIIFHSAEQDIATIIQVLKAGAVDYLIKPCNNKLLIDSIKSALDLDSLTHEKRQEAKDVLHNYQQLSKREKQVMQLMVNGLANKDIAAQLDITLKTVEAHRANVMKKMHTGSLALLVKDSLIFNLQPEPIESTVENIE